MQRVEITLSVVMDEDSDQQNALALNVGAHLLRVADRFGVYAHDGAVSVVISSVEDEEAEE